MSGSKYSYAVTQLQSKRLLNPDAHMIVQHEFYQSEPGVMAAITTQLSLKNGLKGWGYKAHEAVESEMKQLCFRNTLKPVDWKDLSQTQWRTVWSHTCCSRRNAMEGQSSNMIPFQPFFILSSVGYNSAISSQMLVLHSSLARVVYVSSCLSYNNFYDDIYSPLSW
jgi:hypothetical protein